VCWKPCSSCWSFHLLREEFLSAPIHPPPCLGRRIGPSSRKSAATSRPLTGGGRTTTCGGCATLSTMISTTLHGGAVLMTATTTLHYCRSIIPITAFGQRDVGATGRIPERSSTTAAPSVTVANMALYAISSSMISVILDNMINGTNHIV
jgi:hypothetical protein